MVDNIQAKTGAIQPAPAGAKATNANPSSAAAGAAFQALLERLETNARELEVQSRSIDSPQELSGAVDRAHASLQDVLSLSDRLVEAYRETLARDPNAGERR